MTIKQREELFRLEREINERAQRVRALCSNVENACLMEEILDKDQGHYLRIELQTKNGQTRQFYEVLSGVYQNKSKLAPYLQEALRKFQQDAEMEFIQL